MIGIGVGINIQKVGGYGLVAPIATAATGVGQTSFTANWNAYTGAVVYLLDVSTSPTFDTFIYENQQVNAPTTSYVVIGLEPNTTYYYRVRASTESLTDPDAQAFFDRVTTAGGSLSTTEQTAINTLVIQMKADGIWTKMKAIYPMVGASAAACSQNLKSSSFTGTFTATGWAFASTGATPNGTSAYMNTNFIPSSHLTVNNASFSVYVRTTLIKTNTEVDFGAGNATTAIPLTNIESDNGRRSLFAWDYNISLIRITTSDASGMWGVSRSASNSWISFQRNTTFNRTTTTQATSVPNVAQYIGAMNFGGTANSFSSREIAFAHCAESLTSTEFNNFYTAVQAFQTTLNRQVS